MKLQHPHGCSHSPQGSQGHQLSPRNCQLSPQGSTCPFPEAQQSRGHLNQTATLVLQPDREHTAGHCIPEQGQASNCLTLMSAAPAPTLGSEDTTWDVPFSTLSGSRNPSGEEPCPEETCADPQLEWRSTGRSRTQPSDWRQTPALPPPQPLQLNVDLRPQRQQVSVRPLARPHSYTEGDAKSSLDCSDPIIVCVTAEKPLPNEGHSSTFPCSGSAKFSSGKFILGDTNWSKSALKGV